MTHPAQLTDAIECTRHRVGSGWKALLLFQREGIRTAALIMSDTMAITAASLVAVLAADSLGQATARSPSLWAIPPLAVAVLFCCYGAGQCRRQAAPAGLVGTMVRYSAVALALHALLIALFFPLPGSVPMLLAWLVFPVLAIGMRRLIAAAWASAGIGSLRAVLVGMPEATRMAQTMLRTRPRSGFQLAETVSYGWPDGPAAWQSLLSNHGADLVLVSMQGHDDEQALLRSIQDAGVPAAKFIALPSHAERSAGQIGMLGSVAKASLDFLAGLAFVILFLPLMVAVSLIVKLDGGPALFRHERVGRGGQTFDCLKFRTMVLDADKALQELLDRDPEARQDWARTRKLKNDPRVTRIGRFLRATSLDELPQLLNVLRGEMSLVGPRPVVTAELPRYGGDVGYYLASTPGLTGKWQVSGRSDTSYERRVQLDIAYAQEWSFWTDLAILFQTLPAVVFKRGAF